MENQKPDLVRTLISIAFIGGLAAASLWVMKPFLGAIIWATTFAVATWPMMKKIQSWLGGKRSFAVIAMSLGLLAVVAVPAVITVLAAVQNMDEIKTFFANLPTHQIPPPPDWVARIPAVGEKVSAAWAEASAGGFPALAMKFEPYMRSVAIWIAGELGSIGAFLVQFLLTIAITAIMYAGGEKAVAGLRAFSRRLAGQAGVNALVLAGGAIRGVAMGVIGTAIVQSVFGAVGLAIVGVPFIPALTVTMLVLSVAQIGPAPVMVLATIWTFKTQGTGWGVFMAVWTVIDGMLNNFIQPMLIKKGAELPLLLIMAGVLGGLLTFGIIGLFVGPVTLAVTYTLLGEWVKRGNGAEVSSEP